MTDYSSSSAWLAAWKSAEVINITGLPCLDLYVLISQYILTNSLCIGMFGLVCISQYILIHSLCIGIYSVCIWSSPVCIEIPDIWTQLCIHAQYWQNTTQDSGIHSYWIVNTSKILTNSDKWPIRPKLDSIQTYLYHLQYGPIHTNTSNTNNSYSINTVCIQYEIQQRPIHTDRLSGRTSNPRKPNPSKPRFT